MLKLHQTNRLKVSEKKSNIIAPIICVYGLIKWKRKEKQYDKKLKVVIDWKRPKIVHGFDYALSI